MGNVRVNEGAIEVGRALSAGRQRIAVDLGNFVSSIESVVNNSPLNVLPSYINTLSSRNRPSLLSLVDESRTPKA